MIPYSQVFDQQTLAQMIEYDPVVQRYRAFFALFHWNIVPEACTDPSRPGKRPHLQCAYIKALLLKLEEGFATCTRLRRFLIERTVPTDRWLREKQRTLEQLSR